MKCNWTGVQEGIGARLQSAAHPSSSICREAGAAITATHAFLELDMSAIEQASLPDEFLAGDRLHG